MVLAYKFAGGPLQDLYHEHELIFFVMIGGPLVLVAVFSVGPMILRQIRERSLHRIIQDEVEYTAGYYRLTPYEASDRNRYGRPDGAVEQALDWLTSVTDPVLYLSGASGAGKSSLIAAGITSALQDKGWTILNLRGGGAPLAELGNSLRKSTALYQKEPPKDADARALLTLAGENIKRVDTKPLLIILDQFEEFLILESGEGKEGYAAFLNEFAKNPIDNIHILHVFREDYRALLFKLKLPDYLPHKTGFEVAPFSRREAEEFLSKGPQSLDKKGYDALFTGLDRIEDTRGIYRPITLNMIGFVLEKQGATMSADPARLIEIYLKDCITHGPSRDFAKLVLQSMITREGTKQMQVETSIASSTGIADWQVRASLVELEDDGLVRPLSDRKWEISHDFLARQLTQIIGSIRKPWLSRAAVPTLVVAVIGWTVAVSVGVPAWVATQDKVAEQTIRDMGFTRIAPPAGQSDEYHYQYSGKVGLTDKALTEFERFARRFNVTSLDITDEYEITSLAVLKDLPLTSLDLSGAGGITSLAPINCAKTQIIGASEKLRATCDD